MPSPSSSRRSPQPSSFTVSLGKRAFYDQIERDEHGAYDHTREVMTENALAADAQEGMGAFLEKRQPTWTGLLGDCSEAVGSGDAPGLDRVVAQVAPLRLGELVRKRPADVPAARARSILRASDAAAPKTFDGDLRHQPHYRPDYPGLGAPLSRDGAPQVDVDSQVWKRFLDMGSSRGRRA